MSRVFPACVGAVLALTSVVLGVAVDTAPPGLDSALRGAAVGLGPDFQRAADVVSLVLSPGLATVALVSLVLRAWLARDVLALKAAVLLAVCWASVLSRWFYLRVRPVQYDLPSYPSGHVTAVTAVAVTAVVLCAHLRPALVRPVLAVSAVAVVLCAASRVVLEMHWFTDTVGAVLATTGVGLVAALALGLLPVSGVAGGGRRVEP
ncbi:phosphatase PAP2 family protein [Saccharothrix variisporea]|uniref:Undecaprenyl-diphosphatase n=1 Tax=Saccharothrix variisporea TaxID=543527 RepID=A0A495X7C6_9PSEU|nr:phosphatase PAP2 family protein [Saccharothrix variisporea]RKT69892.1 undecaprenyl-diphosphatase [Saccharothrix variisporea]